MMLEKVQVTNQKKRDFKEYMNKIDHEYTGEIVCPNCGQEERDSWEMSDSGEVECDCGITFEYERHVEVTYSSYFKKDECKHENSSVYEGTFMCDDCGMVKKEDLKD